MNTIFSMLGEEITYPKDEVIYEYIDDSKSKEGSDARSGFVHVLKIYGNKIKYADELLKETSEIYIKYYVMIGNFPDGSHLCIKTSSLELATALRLL